MATRSVDALGATDARVSTPDRYRSGILLVRTADPAAMGLDRGDERRYMLRTAALVVAFTAILTTNFIGLMGLVTDGPSAASGRVPFYVLAAAVVFVAALLLLETAEYDGRTVLTASVTAAALGGVLVGLGVEGLIYAWSNPDEVVASQVLVYFLAAAVIATGVGYWGLRHWREFVNQTGR